MMESKLLVGGKSIVDKTTEQERALEEQRIQIAEQQVGFILTGKRMECQEKNGTRSACNYVIISLLSSKNYTAVIACD